MIPVPISVTILQWTTGITTGSIANRVTRIFSTLDTAGAITMIIAIIRDGSIDTTIMGLFIRLP